MAGLALPARLADFLRIQRMHRDEVADQLTSDWTMKVIAIVEQLIPGPAAGEEGGTDESALGSHSMLGLSGMSRTPGAAAHNGALGGGSDVSRVQVMRFVKMISLIMADQLRSAVLGSIDEYVEFWKQYDFDAWQESARAGYHDDALPAAWQPKAPAAEVPFSDDANAAWRRSHAVHKWGEDLFTAVPPPLFTIQLLVKDSAIALSPDLPFLEEAVLASFEDIVTAVQSIDDISVKVVNVAVEQFLRVVDMDDVAVADARAAISAVLHKNLQGPGDLLASFQEYAGLVERDTHQFIVEWEEGRHSLEESEAEIERLARVAESVQVR